MGKKISPHDTRPFVIYNIIVIKGRFVYLLFTLFPLLFSEVYAAYDPCRYIKASFCGKFGGRSSRSSGKSNPSSNDSFNFNPGAINIKKGLGIETKMYRNEYTFGITTGMGRVGAAISPQAEDGHFFGNIPFEESEDFQARIRNRKKFDSRKYALGVGGNITGQKKSGKRDFFTLGAGVIFKYHKDVKRVRPGVGLSSSFGPVNIGGAIYRDDNYNTRLRNNDQFTGYNYSFGLNLVFLASDYSIAKKPNNQEVAILSHSLLVWRFIMTYATRREYSDRLNYDFESDTFNSTEMKEADFYGLQVLVHKHISLGYYHNYYLQEGHTFSISFFM
jgi:hypothetical protein